MSRAFVKESEGEWLGDVGPEVALLERYLSKQEGVPVYLKTQRPAENPDRSIYEMSNGDCYTLDDDNRWRQVID